MIRKLVAVSIAVLVPAPALAAAGDQPVLDACISSWGKKSPFKKGTPADGTIHVTMSSSSDVVTVRVRDSGPGIPLALREQAFAPFYTTKPGGTGLGLAIARRIVTAHSGRIFFEDIPTGGASVIIELPKSASVTT